MIRADASVDVRAPARAGSRPPEAARRVQAELEAARALVQPRIRERIDSLPEDLRRVVAYHFGFVDADGAPTTAPSGKAVRPALALLSAEAAGAPRETGLPGAVAIELVHNFTLLHDDVMDRDERRRHRATAWTVFGTGPAIVAGDALHAMAVDVLLDAPGAPAGRASNGERPVAVAALAALTAATSTTIAGQARDLELSSRVGVTMQEAVAMASEKTAALLGCAASIGALLAGAPDAVVAALDAFGRHLGLAFQAVDDILGIWGHPDLTGKPVASDLRERKKSLPVAAALASGTAAGRRFAELYAGETFGDDEGSIAAAAALVEEAGGRAWAASEADRRVALAAGKLRSVPLERGPCERLLDLAAFVAGRDS